MILSDSFSFSNTLRELIELHSISYNFIIIFFHYHFFFFSFQIISFTLFNQIQFKNKQITSF